MNSKEPGDDTHPYLGIGCHFLTLKSISYKIDFTLIFKISGFDTKKLLGIMHCRYFQLREVKVPAVRNPKQNFCVPPPSPLKNRL